MLYKEIQLIIFFMTNYKENTHNNNNNFDWKYPYLRNVKQRSNIKLIFKLCINDKITLIRV